MKPTSFLTLLLLSVFLFTACEKDPAAPKIKILELDNGDSHGNDHTAKIGGELHMELEVVAEGKISKIQVRVHPEGEHEGEHEMEEEHLDEWEIDTTYTKFSGLKNTTFHEHLDIDASAEKGEYHFDFIVTDMEGNQSEAEAELMIVEK